MKNSLWISLSAVCFIVLQTHAQTNFPLKQGSAFFPKEQLAQIQKNVQKDPWTSNLRDQVITNAQPWMKLSDDELWELMFGATLPRSWMVWSDGYCPSCKKSVAMYLWKMEAWKHPWKVRCPNCEELFPKNDFHAFYKSGLDEHGVFNPASADRKLLFNSEHPDPADPLHHFGVDDGTGYVADGKRWRFIATYLIFGQFHQKILSGIDTLAAAYVLTGDKAYAHKAAILLDRVADVYPTFDFAKQGYVYEVQQASGYISVWHDASEETYEMVLAYDQIFEGLRNDSSLVEFLSTKAKAFKLENPKNSFADIQRNIEGRILRDALAHPEKIHSNFPRRECTEAMIHTVLAWPENKVHVEKLIDQFVSKATAVDGVTGEKGLAGYTAYTIAALARFLNEYARVDPAFLSDVMRRNPGLRQTYRFHIDTHCLEKYYPLLGDTGSFAQPIEKNPMMLYSKFSHTASLRSPLAPSMFSLFWKLYLETGDPAYVQTLYRENNNSVTNLPCDIFEKNPKAVRQSIEKVIAKEGAEIKIGSINKQRWNLALLRSGRGENARVVTLDYDSGGSHGHADGMTLGLFAHGLDLLPDFGYPLVQFGGWDTPRANWYKSTAAHNTVVVNGQNQNTATGKTTLWADGESFRAIRASGPALANAKQFERTVSLIDVSERDFYVVDIFRVAGGTDHAKFVHGYFGKIKTDGITFSETNEFGHGTQTRNFRGQTNASPGWSVTWQCEDRLNLLPKGKEVQMRYTDFTANAEAMTGEAWIVPGSYAGSAEVWNSCVLTRRRGSAPLASTFVSVIEPFSGKSCIAKIRRLPLQPVEGKNLGDDAVALEITLTDGRRDLFIAANAESAVKNEILIQPDWSVRLDGELCWIRNTAQNKIEQIALARAKSVTVGKEVFSAKENAGFTELQFSKRKVR